MLFFLFLQSLNVRIHFGPYFWLIIDLSDSEKRQWSCHDLTLCIREYAKSNSIGCVCDLTESHIQLWSSMVLSGHRARIHLKWLTDGPEGRLLTPQLSQVHLRVGPGWGPHDNNWLPFESYVVKEVQNCYGGVDANRSGAVISRGYDSIRRCLAKAFMFVRC